ncbi:MAG: protein-arginine deiminase [Labilithrix sp.]|nr:protein-arginine deiminase [Labilithrix sp.]
MKLAHFSLLGSLLAAAAVVACGDAGLDGEGESTSSAEPEPEIATSAVGSVVADLRADTNRDGVISFTDPTDDVGEDVWNADHGAVFLANIDDDQERCSIDLDDVDLPKCNDAADEIVNGADDALDLARLKTRPWPAAPSDAVGRVTFTAPDKVRLFKVAGSQFRAIQSGAALSLAEIRSGVELAIEGKDIVRNPAVWNGFVDVTLTVRAEGNTGSDKVRMRVAPVVTFHHALTAEQTWVSRFNAAGNVAMRNDLATAAAAAGVPAPRHINTSDPWTQDFFEPAFMSMPAPNGKQHVIRVNLRSANVESSDRRNPLRDAGRVVFALRGKDVAGIQEYDPQRNGAHDTLNSFGNLETVPPYTHAGKSYPMGRVIRGSVPSFFTDKVFTRMMEAQRVQPPIYVDTSWLLVAHIDETISFVKANTRRGWVLLVNDANLARTMLVQQSNAGRGNVPMHVGKFWSSGASARATIDQVLADPDVMSASAEAVFEVNAQLAIIKAETGLTDAEIVRVPFLHMTVDGHSVAYQPGMVNGLYIADGHFVAPDPHGPVIGGKDIFKAAMQSALAPVGVTVHFAEDWDTYHRNLGEVHCGTNATRRIPTAKWWESGR